MKKLLLAALVCVSGCSFLARGGRSELPPLTALAAGFTQDFSTLQTVSGRVRGHAYSFSAAVEKRSDTIVLVGMTALGNRLFTISLNGELTYQPEAHFEAPLDAQALLQDFLMCHLDGPAIDTVFGKQTLKRVQGSRVMFTAYAGRDTGYDIEQDVQSPWTGLTRCGFLESGDFTTFRTIQYELISSWA